MGLNGLCITCRHESCFQSVQDLQQDIIHQTQLHIRRENEWEKKSIKNNANNFIVN